MANITETELQKRLRKLELGGSGSLVTNIGGSTYEWTDEYTYIAYASTISNVSSAGVIQNQSDATGFSFRAISEAGVPLNWLGYWTSKSLVQSGDPSDYIWTDLSSELPASSVIKYYTESTNLLTNIGDPYNLVAGVPWVLVSGSIPASAFWVASRYIINGTQTPWKIVPVKTKQNDLGLITHTISGRDMPEMNSTQWRTDAIAAISAFTGNVYSTTNEMGFGTVIVIQYDDDKLYGMLKKATCSVDPATNTTQSLCEAVTSPFQGVWTEGGTGTWVTTPTFIDGELLVTETIVADKIAANAITASKLSISGTDDVRTITGSIAGQEAAQATADGEIIGFFQTSEPTAANTGTGAGNEDPKFGDIWIDITGGAPLDPDTDIYRYQDSNGGSAGNLSWVVTNKSAIGVIYLNSYQATADITANRTTYDAFVSATGTDFTTIQNQIDGSITTFFYNVAPTLSNVPASGWDSTNSVTDKTLWYTTHLGDIYYDNVTGYAYRFVYQDIVDSPDAGVIYSWLRITDNDMVTALDNASTAQDTADGKRRVFVNDATTTPTTPAPPYDVGDLWAQGSTGDLKKCVTAKTAEGSYAAGDWAVASKYTDDTTVTTLNTGLTNGTIAIDLSSATVDGTDSIATYVGAQIDLEVVIFSGTDHNETLAGLKADDIYLEATDDTSGAVDIDVNNTWKCTSVDGSGVGTWTQINSNSNLTALADLADGKRTIYSNASNDAPTSPQTNDIWIPTTGTNNATYIPQEVYQWTAGSVWEPATKYTDDTTANLRITTFYKSSTATPNEIPTALAIGDLWSDTGDNFKLYRAASVGANAITAGEWVTVRDGTIATAQAAAATADGKAVAAQGTATAAQDELDDIAADNIVTPSEKLQAKILWDAVYAEKPGIVTSAANAVVASTTYIAEYDALNSYLNNTENVFSSMGTSTTLTPSGEITIGTPNTFNPAKTKGTSVAFDPNTAGKFVVIYEDDDNSDYGTAVVGTVSGTTISYGSEYNFDTGDVSIDSINVAFDPNVADKFVIVWDDNSANKGRAMVGTISGTVISFGSEYTFNTSYSSSITVAFDPNDSDKFVIAYTDQGTGDGEGTAIVGTISGTVISFGSEYIFHPYSANSTDAYDISLAFDPNTTGKFVVTYREYLNTSTSSGTAVVGTISGTALSFGSQYKFVNNSGNGHINDTSVAFDPNAAGKFVIAYSEDDTGGDGKAIVGTISGTAISYGSVYTFNTTNSNETLYNTEIVFDPNWTNTFVISYKKQAYARLARGTLLGTAISFEDFTTSIQATYNAIAFDPNTRTRFIISYKDNSTTHGKAAIGLNGMGTRELWDNKWVLYYTEKQTLLDAIAAKLKTLADTAQEAASDISDNIYVSNTTTIDGGTIAAGTKITAGTDPNVGVLDGTDNSSDGDGPWRIYAGHATAASAPFRVSQTGQVTIDSGGDDRLVLSNDKIEVYDGDVLRVKLGNLA